MTDHYLGIEIGGTKIQVGVGPDDGRLRDLWRGTVDVDAGPEGIRRQILAGVTEVLARSGIGHEQLRGVGIGFGGPVDDATRTVIKSHQIDGWDGFPLADWVGEMVGLPAALGNDADVAGLAEALHGAGKGLSPIFYITIGSGIGGGLIIEGEIYRGVGRGAAEIGHLRVTYEDKWTRWRVGALEQVASGWGIANRVRECFEGPVADTVAQMIAHSSMGQLPTHTVTAADVFDAYRRGDELGFWILNHTWAALAEAICHVITLICPQRIVIGGGVSLVGEELLFAPVRQKVGQIIFAPFAGLTDIVPATLGEEVVVHGAIALARKKLTGSSH